MASAREALQEAALAALPVAVVYFSGWAYLSSYLNDFGLDATQVSVALTTVLVYAFKPLSSWPVLGTCAAFLVVAASAFFLPQRYRDRLAAFNYLFGFVTIVVLLFLIRWVGQNQANELAESVWHGDHLQTQVVPVTPVRGDVAYTNYELCRSGSRLQQILGLPEQTFLLCRSELSPCERGTIYAFGASGAISATANIAHENRGGENGCKPTVH